MAEVPAALVLAVAEADAAGECRTEFSGEVIVVNGNSWFGATSVDGSGSFSHYCRLSPEGELVVEDFGGYGRGGECSEACGDPDGSGGFLSCPNCS